jgi:hypothetical protein
MKLKEYLHHLNQMIEADPECLEMTVITSIDAEGNGYNVVYRGPRIGLSAHEDFPRRCAPQESQAGKEFATVCLN